MVKGHRGELSFIRNIARRIRTMKERLHSQDKMTTLIRLEIKISIFNSNNFRITTLILSVLSKLINNIVHIFVYVYCIKIFDSS